MGESFEIEWKSEPFFTADSLGPIIDCGLDYGNKITEDNCSSRGCFYYNVDAFLPVCFMPQNKGGYKLTNVRDTKYELELDDNPLTLFSKPINNILITVSYGVISNNANKKFFSTRIVVLLFFFTLYIITIFNFITINRLKIKKILPDIGYLLNLITKK